jgi:hypothetical protein
MHAVLPFAKHLLQQYGEFSPYGGYLRTDGSIVQLGVDDPGSEHPATATQVDSLCRKLRERVERGEATAAAIVFDARVTPPGVGHATDAIEVLVQHRDSYCAELLFPYRIRKGRIVFGQMFAQTCVRQILG